MVTFLGAQESDSPAGAKTEGFGEAKSPLVLGGKPTFTEASPCL